jgi:hypothetical protein
LGILFRSVLINDYTADRHHGHIQPSDGLKIWACLLQAKVDLGVLSDNLMEEMKHLLEAYSDQLFAIYCTSVLTIKTHGLASIGGRACQWYNYGTLG